MLQLHLTVRLSATLYDKITSKVVLFAVTLLTLAFMQGLQITLRIATRLCKTTLANVFLMNETYSIIKTSVKTVHIALIQCYYL